MVVIIRAFSYYPLFTIHLSTMKDIVGEIKGQITILLALVGIMWGVEILDTYVFRHGLDLLGILPRETIGLRGIISRHFYMPISRT
jgi:hypothetical protein